MRHTVSFVTLIVFVIALGCKKGEQPSTNLGQPAAVKPPAPVAEKELKEQAPSAEKKTHAESVIAEKAPASKKGELDPSACRERIEAEDRKIRTEVLPKLQAEQEATASMQKWLSKTFKILEASKLVMDRKKLEDFWEEYRSCLKRLTQSREERDPECVAQVTQDLTACDRLADDARTGCRDLIKTRKEHMVLRDFARSGFSIEFCMTHPDIKYFPGGSRFCRAMALASDCGEGLVKALRDNEIRMCEAMKRLVKGEARCGVDFKEGSPECLLAQVASAQDKRAKCLELSAAGILPIPVEVCDHIEMAGHFDCSRIPDMEPPDKANLPLPVCNLLMALKSGQKSCGGNIKEGTHDCTVFLSFLSAISKDRSVCDAIADKHQREHCRTFLAESLDECRLGNSEEWGTHVRDDSSCRKLLIEKVVLPATEGRTELRLTLANVFDDPATCTLKVSATAAASITTRSLEVSFPRSMTRVERLFFVTQPGMTFDVKPTCKWEINVGKEQPATVTPKSKEGQ